MNLKIFCCKCTCDMGVIRDAKLRKGISYICKGCIDREKNTDTGQSQFNSDHPFEFMRSMFDKRN